MTFSYPPRRKEPKPLPPNLPALEAALSTTYVPKTLRGIGPTTFPPQPIVTPLSTYQAGHGWSGSWNITDTGSFLLGSQSTRGVTNGTGGNVETISPTLTPQNLAGKGIAFQVKVDNPDRLAKFTLYWGHDSYAHFRTSDHEIFQGTGMSARMLANEWVWVYVPLSDFTTNTGTVNEAAITNIKLRATDYNTGPLTVHIQQIGIYTPKNTYPNGVLTITGDDSLASQAQFLPKILGKHGAAATLLLIAEQMQGSPVYGIDPATFLQGFSVDRAHELEDKLGYEMGGHAWLVANHNRGMATLSTQELKDELGNLKAWLLSEGFKAADYFAWPVGSNDAPSTKICRKYFSWARHTGGYFATPQAPGQPMRHQSINITSDIPVATYKTHIDFAKAHGRHLTLMVHQIRASGAAGGTNVNEADLQAIVDYAVSVGMPIRTIGQVMRGE